MEGQLTPYKNLTGQRFGQLVAIQLLEERYRQGRMWLCQCDCGKTHKVPRASLTSLSTLTCGCRGRGPKREDLTGQTFGRVTVDRYAYGECWHVTTACGVERLALRRSLIKGMKCCRRSKCLMK